MEKAENQFKDEEIVCSDIKENGFNLSYAYFDASSDVASLSWEENWDKDYLPSGIKVAITFIDRGEKQKMLTFEKNIYVPIGFWGEG